MSRSFGTGFFANIGIMAYHSVLYGTTPYRCRPYHRAGENDVLTDVTPGCHLQFDLKDTCQSTVDTLTE